MTMPDLDRCFEAADLIPAPDLWISIQTRSDTPDELRTPALRLVGRSLDPPSSRTARIRRIMTIAAALLLATLAFGYVIRAFRGHEEVPAKPTPIGIFEPARGWIVAIDGDLHLAAYDPAGDAPPGELAGPSGFFVRLAWTADGQHLL